MPLVSLNRITTREDGPKWSAASHPISRSIALPIANEARETRGNYLDYRGQDRQKTRTANDAVTDASYQIALATQAITFEELKRTEEGARRGTPRTFIHRDFVPVIVTTAHLFTCTFDPSLVAPETGEIGLNVPKLESCKVLVYEYPLPTHVQWEYPAISADPQSIQETARMHIFVVQSTFFPEWLETFYLRTYLASFV
jgi:hypothetical protein